MFTDKVGFKHHADQLSEVISFIEDLATENERLKQSADLRETKTSMKAARDQRAAISNSFADGRKRLMEIQGLG